MITGIRKMAIVLPVINIRHFSQSILNLEKLNIILSE